MFCPRCGTNLPVTAKETTDYSSFHTTEHVFVCQGCHTQWNVNWGSYDMLLEIFENVLDNDNEDEEDNEEGNEDNKDDVGLWEQLDLFADREANTEPRDTLTA